MMPSRALRRRFRQYHDTASRQKMLSIKDASNMQDEASYICDACGEEIVIPVDPSIGSSQEFVEDCPVCCRPNVIHVEIDEDGDVQAWAEPE